ncbi:39581_t:CDS:2 [Gigaspora margarita]|uniref:39581_t:CDS:1 n=1 Tax=Gigaspora margarita TaxID=4874 RepID=A0ABN7V0X4_GIGMA|nr:39581_t:CDS:2 [Gigaspora margarita]
MKISVERKVFNNYNPDELAIKIYYRLQPKFTSGYLPKPKTKKNKVGKERKEEIVKKEKKKKNIIVEEIQERKSRSIGTEEGKIFYALKRSPR